MDVTIRSDATDYTDDELKALSFQATEAALFVLMPHFQDERFTLNKYDHEMIRIAVKLMIMRKVKRPIITG
jgi:hypothetical protein